MVLEIGAVEKVLFYPHTPQGGLAKLLDFNKSPLGDLGVATKRKDFFNIPNDTLKYLERGRSGDSNGA